MKTTIVYILTAALVLSGCASSDNTTAQDTSVGNTTTTTSEASGTPPVDPDSQAPMDPDTDMSSEDTTDTNVSASNDIGRNMNIFALLRDNPEMTTLVELIRAADLVVLLESPAPYTMFAPTNAAFAAIPAATLEALKQPGNKYELTKLLQAHVLPNRITSNEMKNNMPMITTQGEELVVQRDGNSIKVGGANVIQTDVVASNGVIHVIDKVLVPPKN